MSLPNDTCRIQLYGQAHEPATFALVDPEDFEWLNQYHWDHLSSGYARRTTSRAKGKKRSVVYMHRQIMGLEKGDERQVDHINQDKLDNRRSNLRIVTQAQNLQNVGARKGARSRYRGVMPNGKTWTASYLDNHIGSFETEIEAAAAAAQYRHEHIECAVEDPALLAMPSPKRLIPYRERKRGRVVATK